MAITGKIYALDELDSDKKKKIAMEQFQPLPAEMKRLHQELLAAVANLRNTSEYGEDDTEKLLNTKFRSDHITIDYGDMRQLIEPLPRGNDREIISQLTLNNYADCICIYANAQRAAARAEGVRDNEDTVTRPGRKADPKMSGRMRNESRSRSPPSEHQYRKYRDRNNSKSKGKTAVVSPSCKYIKIETFMKLDETNLEPDQTMFQIAKESMCDEHFINNNSKRDNIVDFQKLDYLFIPYHNPQKKHYTLLGIAPKQQFFFAIESSTNTYNIHDWPGCGLYQLALTVVPKKQVMGIWPCFGKYSKRSSRDDGSPMSVQQRDQWNCGVFTATNATCLAFGYDLMSYDQGESFSDRVRLTELMDNGKRPRMAAELHEGGFVAPHFTYDLIEIPTKVKRFIPPPKPQAISLSAPSDTDGNTLVEQGGLPDDTDGWPAQINPELFERAGFLYPISSEEELYWERFTTKIEMVRTARERGVRGYSKWVEKDIEVLRRWIQNYCAASDVLARNAARREGTLRGEMELPPMIGLGRKEAGRLRVGESNGG